MVMQHKVTYRYITFKRMNTCKFSYEKLLFYVFLNFKFRTETDFKKKSLQLHSMLHSQELKKKLW